MNDKKEYPLFPELTEHGQQQAIELIGRFRRDLIEQARSVAEEAMGQLYCDVLPHIEGDAWSNFRTQLLNGLTDYRNAKVQGEYDFKRIRRAMFEEYREEIAADLNKDLLEENEQMKKQIEDMQNRSF